MGALDKLRNKYKDLEDIIRFLEEASAEFERILEGKHSDIEVNTLEEALALGEDTVYVREADVTLSRKLKGESIAALLDELDRIVGGSEPLEAVYNEIVRFIRYLNENPTIIKKLDEITLADLLRIARLVMETNRQQR